MGPTGFPYDLAPRADELPQKISCARVHLSEAPWVAFAIFFGRNERNMILLIIHDTTAEDQPRPQKKSFEKHFENT